MEGSSSSKGIRSITEAAQGDDWIQPLSGKPFFDIIVSPSHINPVYNLFLPAKMYDVLPPMEVPAVLMYKGREWKIVYYGGRTKGKRFSTKWKHFVDDNDLRVGDACIFELMACTARKLKLRVQILRGDIPRALQARFHGEGRDHPGVGY